MTPIKFPLVRMPEIPVFQHCWLLLLGIQEDRLTVPQNVPKCCCFSLFVTDKGTLSTYKNSSNANIKAECDVLHQRLKKKPTGHAIDYSYLKTCKSWPPTQTFRYLFEKHKLKAINNLAQPILLPHFPWFHQRCSSLALLNSYACR